MPPDTPPAPASASPLDRMTPAKKYGLTLLACLATTALATPLLDHLDRANIAMLYLLTVLLVAVKLGRNPAVLASVLSVVLFDLFFVPPRFSLAVHDLQYLVTFAVMLVTGLITAQLASGLRQRVREAQAREQQTQALYQFARQLAGVLTLQQVDALSRDFIAAQWHAQSALMLPVGEPPHLQAVSMAEPIAVEPHLLDMALTKGQRVHSDQVSGMGYAALYVPLLAPMRTRGVLVVKRSDADGAHSAQTVEGLQAVASLIAIAVERLHYVDVAQATELHMRTERLRSSILSALSHDLRTPLTAMVGLADSLSLVKPALPATALETAQTLREQAERLAGMVSNLLDMARLNAGHVQLRKEWHPLDEVIGSSIKLLGAGVGGALTTHPIKVSLSPQLPLVEFDAVLMERVLCNLLENAAKYSPAGTAIDIAAQPIDGAVQVDVIDHGAGFPLERQDDLFKMFVRGTPEGNQPGVGLGLAICKVIVEAHGGTITALRPEAGGTCIRLTLPQGVPPVVEEDA